MAYFNPGSVIWELQSTNKFDAIREVISRSQTFTEHARLDTDKFAEAVVARERLHSTGLGHGVAVAHGYIDEVISPRIALGVSRSGIDFEAVDHQPVQLLFVVANHPSQEVDYLHILSALVGMVRNEIFRREILTCSHESDARQKLREVFGRLLKRKRHGRAG